jgi:uncharacterized protein YbbK (DUF523 family)
MSAIKVLVSACLLGEAVRYDGRDNQISHPFLRDLLDKDAIVPACPETLGGLPTPRPYAEIVQRFPIQIIASDQTDVTDEFVTGAEITLELAQKHGCVAALMKAGSPSCGNKAGSTGVAAEELLRHGLPVFNEDQIDELESFLLQSTADLAITA